MLSNALQHVLLQADSSTTSVKSCCVFTYISFSCILRLSPVDQSMFENSIAQQQSPQTSRTGQSSAQRPPASVNPNLGSSSADTSYSGGQQRLKNAINLGKAVGAKVSKTQKTEM